MLSSSSSITPSKTPTRRQFCPLRSSPLSNCGSSPVIPLTSWLLPSPPQSPPSFMQPKRLFKSNPILRSQNEGRTARRDLFIKKVRTGREDKYLKSRGGEDEIMRMVFIAEQKRLKASLERAASNIATIYEEEEILDCTFSNDIPAFVQESEVDTDSITYTEPAHQCQAFYDYLDRDGLELEDLLSQMDLDLDHGLG